MKNKTKFKKTEIGMIPEDWDFDELSKYVNVNMGQSPPSKFYNSKKEGMKFLQGITTFGTKYPTFDTWTTKVTKVSKKGDVLYSVRAPVGEVNIVTEKICIGRGLAALRMKNGTNEFLYYLLKNFQKYIENFASGSVFSAISGKELKFVKLPFPPLPKQRAIAKILSDLDAKIELLQKQNETLEKIGQAIFKHWFVDFEFPNEEGKPYKSSGGEMVYSEELGKEIPKGWRVEKLGSILSLEYGKGLPKNKRKEGNFPVYGSGGINGYNNEYLIEGPGIVVGRAGCPGKVYLVKDNFWPVDSTFYVSCEKNNFFLIYFILKFLNLERLNSGSAVPGLNRNIAYEQKVIYSPEKIRDRFNEVNLALFDKKWKNESQIQTLKKIRDSLLPKLMTGKIRVPFEVRK